MPELITTSQEISLDYRGFEIEATVYFTYCKEFVETHGEIRHAHVTDIHDLKDMRGLSMLEEFSNRTTDIIDEIVLD